ncbi:nucleotidyltransferase [Mucilaginibacter rubeus]|uniref:Nucleotidyltransferase n=1 Tax=Mucilaginibacter rubeus TaxID=2027860 RepID=A0A5C1I6A0_9SPHI|nr:nucleotidyltransferase [Mucilaginibacter rubeus]QEM13489.1 nucleotidyltransferase [Mucilaginibacter rubeus]
MAQTIDYWYKQIINRVYADEKLSELNSTSAVADYKLWAYIVASVIWTLDTLFDKHRAAIEALLALLKPHTLRWYRDLALRFQYGQALIPDSDKYANVGLDDAAIAAQKIIEQAAVVENDDGSLRMKVVKLIDDDYAQLTDQEKLSFVAYIKSCKDAGVRVNIDSLPPDGLKLVLSIYYDPLVLNAAGERIDAASTAPVIDAVNNYLKNLQFNGEFAKTRLSDAIQLVDGVQLVSLASAQAQYGLRPFEEINERYIPDAGYLRVTDGGFTITYVPYV